MNDNGKIAVIFGSARSDGNTKKVCETFAALTAAQIFDFNDYKIGYYDYAHDHDDDYHEMMEELVQYDVFIFATPVYWYAMSAQLKTFFDRITDLLKTRKDLGYQLKEKAFGLISCGSDHQEVKGFNIPFIETAKYLGADYLGYAHTWIQDMQISPDAMANLKLLADMTSQHQLQKLDP